MLWPPSPPPEERKEDVMLFVALANAHPGTLEERMKKRLEYQYPEGCKLVAEYWLQTDHPTVIVVFEAERIEPVIQATGDWDPFFDIEIFPAIDYKAGIELAKEAYLVAA
jgi:hypothetical protein